MITTTNKTKKSSWINMVKTVQHVNRELVIRKLNITEERYWDLMLDAGTRYLVDTLKVDDCLTDIMGADLYWKWWLNHWQRWDAAWLEEEKAEHPWLKEELYHQLHDASEYGFAPNRIVLKELFTIKVLDKIIQDCEYEATKH